MRKSFDTLAELVRSVDADTPIYWVRTHERAIEMARVGPEILARIFGGFGILGLILAAAGLYGVLSFAVSERTREIGLRRAIGAQTAHVLRSIAGRSAWQVGIGLGIGIVLGAPFGMALWRWAGDDAPLGMSVFLVALTVMVAAAASAALVPARRALAVDPMVALRYE